MKKGLLSLLISISFIMSLTAQNITISVTVTPPYTNKLSDYNNKIISTLIYNLPSAAQSVKLKGRITGDNGVTLASIDFVSNTNPIILSPGIPRIITAAEISNIFDINNLTITGITKSNLQSKGLPGGVYNFCIYAYDFTTGALLTADDPNVCSADITIPDLLTDIEPPQIITPTEDQEIISTTPQNLVISWTLPAGATPNLQYTLRMVDVIPITRDPNDAMSSAVYPYFFEQTVYSNVFVFGPSQPQLKVGHTYAFTVTAKDPFNKVLFKNNGTSETSVFKVIQGYSISTIALSDTISDNNPSVHAATSDINDQQLVNFLKPLTTVVSGRINYKYKEDASNAPMKNCNIRLVEHLIFRTSDGKNQYEVDPFKQPDGILTDEVKTYMEYLRYYYSGSAYNYTPNDYNIWIPGGENMMTLATGTTDANGYFNLTGVLPVLPGLTDNSLGKIFQNIKMTTTYLTPQYNDGIHGSHSGADNNTIMTGDLWRVWHIVVENPYYCSPTDDIIVSGSGTKNMGQLYGYVKSFTEQIKTIAGWGTNSNNYVDALKPIPGGLMGYAYRKYSPLGFPDFEGETGISKTIEGYPVMAATASTSEGYIVFKKLVCNQISINSNIHDRQYYYIKPDVTKDKNYADAQGIFGLGVQKISANEATLVFNDEFTIGLDKHSVTVEPLPPMISGTLIGVFQGHVKNATITLKTTTVLSNDIYTTSDDNGYFEFTNLTAGEAYSISIFKQGYEYDGFQEVFKGGKLKNGQRVYTKTELVPLAQLHGFVVDEEGKGIDCHISLNDGEDQSEEAFKALMIMQNGHLKLLPTEFTIAVPKDKIHLHIDADDETFIDYDTTITVNSAVYEVGNIKIKKLKRRLELTVSESVKAQNVPVSVLQPVKNARVLILGQSDTLYTNDKGKIIYSFISSGSDNFDVLVLGPKGKYYEPKLLQASLKPSLNNTKYSVIIKSAAYIKGVVTDGTNPVAGATVRIENGSSEPEGIIPLANVSGLGYSGGNSSQGNNSGGTYQMNDHQNTVNLSNQNVFLSSQNAIYVPELAYSTVTDQNGVFILKNVPSEKNLILKAGKISSQYIGAVDTVYVPATGVSNVTLKLTLYNDMDLTSLYGFPLTVEGLTTTNGKVKISGYISKIKSNTNFKTLDDNQKLSFYNVTVIKGTKSQGALLPSAVPESGVVNTINTECKIVAYNIYTGKLSNPFSVLKIEEYTKSDGQKTGGISGKAFIEGSSFHIPNLKFETDILLNLVKKDGSLTNTYHPLNSDGSAIAENTKGFRLNSISNTALKFKFHDFDCSSNVLTTYLNKDTIFLQTTLHTTFDKIKPADWNLNLGKLAITTTYASTFSGTKLDSLKMEKWAIASDSWGLDDYGFHISKGKLNMSGLIVPFTGMKVEPKTVKNAVFELQSMKLLGIVDLNLSPAAVGFLNYDKTAGIDSWEMRITSSTGICATINTGLPAIATTDVIQFELISLYSNNQQNYYGLSKNTPKLRIQNVLDFSPGQFFVGPDYITVQGEFNLGIPNCKNDVNQKDEFSSELQYKKSGRKLVFSHKKFSFGFFARGVTHNFPETEEQSLTYNSFIAHGTVKEDPLFTFKTRLLKSDTKTDVVVDPTGQSWNFSGGKSMKNITGSMEVINSNTDWTQFKYEGDVTESTFNGAKGRMKFTVLGNIQVDDADISLTAIPTPFGLGGLTYDFAQKALIGTVHIDNKFGTASISGDAQVRFDSKGWFFLGGGTLTMPGPISSLQAGILFADYDASKSNAIQSQFTQYTYNGKMPNIFTDQKIQGFYFCGSASLPWPLLPPNIDLNLVVAHEYWITAYGGNIGFGANFADSGKKFEVDEKVFVSLKMGVDIDLFVYGYGGNAFGEGYAFASGDYDISSGNYSLTGGGGIIFGGNVHIWTLACLHKCDLINVDLSKNYEISCTIAKPGGINFAIGEKKK